MALSRPLKLPWFHILLALVDVDRHGYGIQREVLDRTEGQLRLWPAMLYRSLDRFEKEGLIRKVKSPQAAPKDERRVYYSITSCGRRWLTGEAQQYASWAAAAAKKSS